MSLAISFYSHQGSREYMEDRHVVLPHFAGSPHLTLCVVCDGHGGAETSTFLIGRFPEHLQTILLEEQKTARTTKSPQEKKNAGFETLMGRALQNCIDDWDIYCFGKDRDKMKLETTRDEWFKGVNLERYTQEGKMAGSTLVAVLINLRKKKAYVVNIGDSRCVYKLNSAITQTIDDNVKARKIPGYKLKIKDRRLEGDLAMGAAVGDNSEKLSGKVDRTFSTQKISFGGKVFRAVIASDGLYDVLTNQQLLFDTFASAEAIAQRALAEIVEKKKQTCEDTGVAVPADFKPEFDDNVSIIYVLDSETSDCSEKAQTPHIASLAPLVSSGTVDLRPLQPPQQTADANMEVLMRQMSAMQKQLVSLKMQQPTVDAEKQLNKTLGGSGTKQRRASTERTSNRLTATTLQGVPLPTRPAASRRRASRERPHEQLKQPHHAYQKDNVTVHFRRRENSVTRK